MNSFRKLLGVVTALGIAIGGIYAYNGMSQVQTVPSIVALQALGAAAPQYPTIFVQNYLATGIGGGGGDFVWNTTSTTTPDHCNVFQATGVTTGRYIRKVLPSESAGVPLLNCGAAGDGTTVDTAAFGFAKAAIEASGKFGYILGQTTRAFVLNAPITMDIVKEGLDCRNSFINGTSLGLNAALINLDSTDANPYSETRPEVQNCKIQGPTGGNPGTGTSIGLNFAGTLGGAVASISVVNSAILAFHAAAQFGSNAYLVTLDHDNLYFNDIGILDPAGCTNCGENISVVNSEIFNNTNAAISISNSNGDINVSNSSIDYNQTNGGATACQISIVDAAVSITNSHIEDFTHPVDCITSGGSTPALTLTGNTYVRPNGASSHLIDAGNGGYVTVNGGSILAAVSPQTTFGASAGGFINIMGLGVGSAVFDGSAGTYYLCNTGAGTCTTNRATSSNLVTTTTVFYQATGYTVAALPTPQMGMFVYVTNATACTFGSTPTGGGSVKCPVWYNGSGWIEY